jgi:uncharacterized YccA/Bax inhibitor family protein
MSVKQIIKDFKDWLNWEVEYTQTKVEKPNKSKVGWYILIGGGIIATLGIIILMLSPYKEVAYEGIRNKRLPPFDTISSSMIVGGLVLIVASLFVFVNTEEYSNKEKV